MLSQLAQNSSKITETTDPASIMIVAPKQMVVMLEVSWPNLTLQSAPLFLSSGSLQEYTTNDDYNFRNLPSWISSLISEKSMGDPELNSEQHSNDMLLSPLYSPSN